MSVASMPGISSPFLAVASGLEVGVPFQEKNPLGQGLGVLHFLNADFLHDLGQFAVILILQFVVLGHVLGYGRQLPGTGLI